MVESYLLERESESDIHVQLKFLVEYPVLLFAIHTSIEYHDCSLLLVCSGYN